MTTKDTQDTQLQRCAKPQRETNDHGVVKQLQRDTKSVADLCLLQSVIFQAGGFDPLREDSFVCAHRRTHRLIIRPWIYICIYKTFSWPTVQNNQVLLIVPGISLLELWLSDVSPSSLLWLLCSGLSQRPVNLNLCHDSAYWQAVCRVAGPCEPSVSAQQGLSVQILPRLFEVDVMEMLSSRVHLSCWLLCARVYKAKQKGGCSGC